MMYATAFERFTLATKKVMALTRAEAKRLNHECVGTEHLLLGLARLAQEEQSHESVFVRDILARFGIEPLSVCLAVEGFLVAGSNPVGGELPQTSGFKQAIVFAYDEARGLGHNHVVPAHILLGLMRDEIRCRVAGHVLRSVFSLKLEDVRQAIILMLDQLPLPQAVPVGPSKIPATPVACELGINPSPATLKAMLERCLADAGRILNHTGGGTEEEPQNRVARGQGLAILALALAITNATAVFAEAGSE